MKLGDLLRNIIPLLLHVGLFEKFEGSEHNEFVKVAKSDDEIQFVETRNNNVAKLLFPDLKANNVFIGMVKTEVERYTAYDGPYKMDKLLEFVSYNKNPLITKLSEAVGCGSTSSAASIFFLPEFSLYSSATRCHP